MRKPTGSNGSSRPSPGSARSRARGAAPQWLTVCFRGSRRKQAFDAFPLRVRRSAGASRPCSWHSLSTHSLANPRRAAPRCGPFLSRPAFPHLRPQRRTRTRAGKGSRGPAARAPSGSPGSVVMRPAIDAAFGRPGRSSGRWGPGIGGWVRGDRRDRPAAPPAVSGAA